MRSHGAHWKTLLKGTTASYLKVSLFWHYVDKIMDKSVDQQLIMYTKFLDEIDGNLQSAVCFLGLVSPVSRYAEDIKVF